MKDSSVPLPTALSKRLVRYVLGFGVGISIGLAPYLGLLRVPLFAPLLNLIPDSIQNTIIPLSAAFMGTLAVAIQWYANENIVRSSFRRLFRITMWVVVASFILLLVLHTFVVVSVPILGGQDSITFVVGFNRPQKPPCTSEVSDSECIKRITLDPSAVASFWGDRQVRLASISLMFSYLAFTGSFGALIGLMLLRDASIQKKVASRKRRAEPPKS
jgi:hypothetical protein